MRTLQAIGVSLLVATALTAQSPTQALMQADRDFAKAVATDRLEGWMAFMADNVAIPAEPPIAGKAAARDFYAKVWSNPDFKLEWEPTKQELLPGDSKGYTVGRWKRTAKNKDGKIASQTGTYITLWEKQKDGSWKVISDTGSADPQ